MYMIDRVAVTRRNVKTPTNPIYFHIAIDLTALRESMFELVKGFVILTLFNFSHLRYSPPFDSIGLLYFLASITTPV